MVADTPQASDGLDRDGGRRTESGPAANPLSNAPPRSPGRRVWVVRLLVAAVAIALLVRFVPRIVLSLTHATTDDAYIQATTVPLSAEVAGKVLQVYVGENATVAAGDSLLRIDPADYELALLDRKAALAGARSEERRVEATVAEQEKARARALAEASAADAKTDLAEKELGREKRLLDGGAASQSQYDQIESAARVARATAAAARAAVAQIEANLANLPNEIERSRLRVGQAESALRDAELNLERTLVRAPVTGTTARKNVDPGKYVAPGQPLMAIVQVGNPWIVANFKETQIRKMLPAQPVEIRLDAYPARLLRGHVASFQPGTGAVFSLLPSENATGNFVKVTQRIPVTIVIDSPPDPAYPLYPGLSARVAVDLHAKGAAAR